MSVEVLMPKVGMSPSELVVQEWLVATGDQVTDGQIIALVESDKTIVEVEAIADGAIELRAAEGDEARPGELIAVITPVGVAASSSAPPSAPAHAAPSEARKPPTGEEVPAWLLTEMLRARYLDLAHMKYIRQGRCESMSHPATGQEAISAGITAALRAEDILYPTFRGYGDYLGRGTDMGALVAELMGRRTGINRGVGGIHLGDAFTNTHGVSGMLGAVLTMAVGSAQAVKLRGEPRVVMVHVGEGAFNTPDSHAMLNMAAIWQLPLVIVVTNNQAVEFSYHDVHFPPDADGIGSRADHYKIANARIDGNDVDAVHQAASTAVAGARAGRGPGVLELVTCRMAGHFDADPGDYIDTELLAAWEPRDPIRMYEQRLVDNQVMDADAIALRHEAAEAEVEAAFKAALDAPLPDPADMFDHVVDTPGVV